MTCPMCGAETIVDGTRDMGDSVVRYRKCRECKYRFYTIETDEDMYQRLKKGQKESKDD